MDLKQWIGTRRPHSWPGIRGIKRFRNLLKRNALGITSRKGKLRTITSSVRCKHPADTDLTCNDYAERCLYCEGCQGRVQNLICASIDLRSFPEINVRLTVVIFCENKAIQPPNVSTFLLLELSPISTSEIGVFTSVNMRVSSALTLRSVL